MEDDQKLKIKKPKKLTSNLNKSMDQNATTTKSNYNHIQLNTIRWMSHRLTPIISDNIY